MLVLEIPQRGLYRAVRLRHVTAGPPAWKRSEGKSLQLHHATASRVIRRKEDEEEKRRGIVFAGEHVGEPNVKKIITEKAKECEYK